MHPAVSLAVRKFQHQVSLSSGMTGFAKRFWVSILRMNVFRMIDYAILGCIVTHVSLYKHEKKPQSFKSSVFVVTATVPPAVSLVVDKLEHQVSLSSGMTVFADRVSSLKMNMFGIIYYAIHGRTMTHVS